MMWQTIAMILTTAHTGSAMTMPTPKVTITRIQAAMLTIHTRRLKLKACAEEYRTNAYPGLSLYISQKINGPRMLNQPAVNRRITSVERWASTAIVRASDGMRLP